MDFFKDNWELLAGLFGSIIAYFGGKKTRILEEKKSETDALTVMQGTYDSFVQDFRERYQEIKEDLKQYREEQLVLRQEVTQLRTENTDLRRELKEWEQKYTRLKKEFEQYKKEN